MIVADRKGNKYNAIACKKPLMSFHRGRTWDSIYATLNGESKTLHLDTTWGKCAYFEHNCRWYRIKVLQLMENGIM